MRNWVMTFMLLISITAISQELTFKRGEIVHPRGFEMNKKEVRALLAAKPGLLNYYNSGVGKKNAAGFMLGFGGGLILGDLAVCLTTDTHYPTALTVAGAGSALIAVPLYMAGRKKLKTVVRDYNKEIAGQAQSDVNNVEFIVSNNGAGLRMQF